MPHKRYHVNISERENHKAGRLYPSFYSEGVYALQTRERRVIAIYVIYSDLIQIDILIVALANLIYQVYKGKKK